MFNKIVVTWPRSRFCNLKRVLWVDLAKLDPLGLTSHLGVIVVSGTRCDNKRYLSLDWVYVAIERSLCAIKDII